MQATRSHKTSSKVLSIFLAMIMTAALVVCLPTKAYAADTVVINPTDSVADINARLQTAINTTPQGGFVTVIGGKYDVDSAMTLYIPDSFTLRWEADFITTYPCSVNTMIHVSGAGRIEVSNCTLENKNAASDSAVLHSSESTFININNSAIKATGNGRAISAARDIQLVASTVSTVTGTVIEATNISVSGSNLSKIEKTGSSAAPAIITMGITLSDARLEIIGNVEAASSEALRAQNSTLTIIGDFTSTGNAILSTLSTVTIVGNITSGGIGLSASTSNIEVTGSINAAAYGVSAGSPESTVTINGDIRAGIIGVYATHAEVSVNGNITVTGPEADVGIFPLYGARITIDGTVTAPNYIKFYYYESEYLYYVTAADYEATSTKPGFLQYTGGTYLSCVWVRGTIAGSDLKLSYSTHVQSIGWQPAVEDGEVSGTTGYALRLEGLILSLENTTGYSGGISYATHVQNIGWQLPVSVVTNGFTPGAAQGGLAGTSGQALRLEALYMELTGDLANGYDIYYRTHVQNIGWTGWAKNGQPCGSANYAYRLEAIQITLVTKGSPAPSDFFKGASSASASPRMIDVAEATSSSLSYSATVHIQNIGDRAYPTANGITQLGTSGQALRLEAVTLDLVNAPLVGGLAYQTHIQNIGWQETRTSGQMSGTTGQALRLEAIRITLTGNMANYYDIYYRTHVQNIGWTGWAKNGQSCGSANYAYRMEAIQIVIVPKGGTAPGLNTGYFYQW